MRLEIYQIDAFTSDLFKGNPAMVVPLKEWLPDNLMQDIAAENNLSETAFYVPEGDGFYIRWFTPTVEVELCGHATLATAFVIKHREEVEGGLIRFKCKSGALLVEANGAEFTLDFPITLSVEIDIPEWASFIGEGIVSAHKCGKDYLFVFNNEQEILELKPNFSELKKIKSRGLIVTAKGEKFDFVSRFFAPAAGIDEDPVTGSAHTKLTPYWSTVLGKSILTAKQISQRGGELSCELIGDRVKILGRGVLFLKGEIYI
jgi:PhzF family phenazine biosynthesis protein